MTIKLTIEILKTVHKKKSGSRALFLWIAEGMKRKGIKKLETENKKEKNNAPLKKGIFNNLDHRSYMQRWICFNSRSEEAPRGKLF